MNLVPAFNRLNIVEKRLAYHLPMAMRWKRLIAVLLLAFSATTLAASACATTCFEVQQALASHAPPCHDQDSPSPSACPLSQLCAFASAAAVISDGTLIAAVPGTYISPFTGAIGPGVDPAPPLKPPPT